jgi:hypothetical protein
MCVLHLRPYFRQFRLHPVSRTARHEKEIAAEDEVHRSSVQSCFRRAGTATAPWFLHVQTTFEDEDVWASQSDLRCAPLSLWHVRT